MQYFGNMENYTYKESVESMSYFITYTKRAIEYSNDCKNELFLNILNTKGNNAFYVFEEYNKYLNRCLEELKMYKKKYKNKKIDKSDCENIVKLGRDANKLNKLFGIDFKGEYGFGNKIHIFKDHNDFYNKSRDTMVFLMEIENLGEPMERYMKNFSTRKYKILNHMISISRYILTSGLSILATFLVTN